MTVSKKSFICRKRFPNEYLQPVLRSDKLTLIAQFHRALELQIEQLFILRQSHRGHPEGSERDPSCLAGMRPWITTSCILAANVTTSCLVIASESVVLRFSRAIPS